MMIEQPASPIPLAAGQRFATWTTVVTEETQRRCHAAMDVPAERFGPFVDPVLLGNECFRALRLGGISIDGWVQTAHVFDQEIPARLDEPLVVDFEVVDVRQHRRGELQQLRFRLADADGRRLSISEIHAIRTDIDKMGSLGGGTAAPKVGPVLARKHLTPERVVAFSDYVGNDLHLDEPFARARGFRAPVAQGLMTTGFFTGELATAGPIGRLRMTCRYLSPVFWDDEVTVAGDTGRLFAITGDGRLAAEAEIDDISHMDPSA